MATLQYINYLQIPEWATAINIFSNQKKCCLKTISFQNRKNDFVIIQIAVIKSQYKLNRGLCGSRDTLISGIGKRNNGKSPCQSAYLLFECLKRYRIIEQPRLEYGNNAVIRSEEHTSALQSQSNL